MTVEITMEPTAVLEVTFEGQPTVEIGVPPLGDALDALAAVDSEATTRAAADANLQSQINALGGGGSTAVLTVDGIPPDGTGDVPLGLAPVARSANYTDLIGTPTLGTAAAASTGDFEAAGSVSAAITSEVARANAAYDAAGAAAAAQAAAISASQPNDADLSAIAALTTTAYGRGFLTLANQGSLMALLGSASDTAQGIVELATSAEALSGVDTVRAVTPAGVKAVVDALINGAPGALDTLGEIAAQLASDESAVNALTTTVAGKLAKASNLSDLLDISVARTNLGLGDIATHAVSEFQPADGDLDAIAALTTTAFGRSLLTSADAAALRTAAALGNSATRDVGTTAGTVAAGDDSRITGAAQKSANLSDLAAPSTARTNLGLGTAATKNTGTASGTIPLLGTGGLLAPAQMGSGTRDGTRFLRDDGTWQTVTGGGGGVTTPTIAATASNAGSSSTASVTLPTTGATVGDLIICFISSAYLGPGAAWQPVPPTGWNVLGESNVSSSGFDNFTILSRVYQTGDGGTTPSGWTLGGSGAWAVHCFVVHGWTRVDQVEANATHGTFGTAGGLTRRLFYQGGEHKFTPNALLLGFIAGNIANTAITLNGLTTDITRSTDAASASVSGHMTWATPTGVGITYTYPSGGTVNGEAFGGVSIV